MITVTGYCSLQATNSWLQLLATVLFKQPVHDYSYWLLFSSSNQFMTTVTGYCSLQATSSWLQSLATVLFKQPIHDYSPLATVLFDYSYWLLFSSSNQFMPTVTGYCSLQATSSWLQSLATVLFKQLVHDYSPLATVLFKQPVHDYSPLATVLFKQPFHDYSHWLLFSSSNQFMTTVHWLLFSSSNQFMTTVTGYCSLQATSSWLQSTSYCSLWLQLLATVLFKQPVHDYSPLATVLFDYSYWLLFSSSNQFMTTVTGYCSLQATSSWLQSTSYCSLWLQLLATVLFKQPVHDQSLATVLFKQPVHDYHSLATVLFDYSSGSCPLLGTSSWLQSTSYCSLWLQLLVAVLLKQPVHDYSHWLLFSSSN